MKKFCFRHKVEVQFRIFSGGLSGFDFADNFARGFKFRKFIMRAVFSSYHKPSTASIYAFRVLKANELYVTLHRKSTYASYFIFYPV